MAHFSEQGIKDTVVIIGLDVVADVKDIGKDGLSFSTHTAAFCLIFTVIAVPFVVAFPAATAITGIKIFSTDNNTHYFNRTLHNLRELCLTIIRH